MALSTAQLRQVYAPACRDSGKNFAAAYAALDACLRKWGYRPDANTGAYNCREITGGSGYSLHAYPDMAPFTFWNGRRIGAMALAVDINPTRNPYGRRLVTDMPRGMVDDILAIRTTNGKQVWGWGGYYRGNKDAMHYEIVCSPADLATGIGTSTPGLKELFTVGQYEDIKKEFEGLRQEMTNSRIREERAIELLHQILGHVDGLVSTIRSSGHNVADAFRRIMGVATSDDSATQGRNDAATGKKVQSLLDRPPG